jgi:non-canonical (house-cleaning) NTP pyrophosphatase
MTPWNQDMKPSDDDETKQGAVNKAMKASRQARKNIEILSIATGRSSAQE